MNLLDTIFPYFALLEKHTMLRQMHSLCRSTFLLTLKSCSQCQTDAYVCHTIYCTYSVSHAHGTKMRFSTKKNRCSKTQFQFQSETLAHTDSCENFPKKGGSLLKITVMIELQYAISHLNDCVRREKIHSSELRYSDVTFALCNVHGTFHRTRKISA